MFPDAKWKISRNVLSMALLLCEVQTQRIRFEFLWASAKWNAALGRFFLFLYCIFHVTMQYALLYYIRMLVPTQGTIRIFRLHDEWNSIDWEIRNKGKRNKNKFLSLLFHRKNNPNIRTYPAFVFIWNFTAFTKESPIYAWIFCGFSSKCFCFIH